MANIKKINIVSQNNLVTDGSSEFAEIPDVFSISSVDASWLKVRKLDLLFRLLRT